jgi:DNA-binding MarR family transcriptional regulator
MESLHYLLMKTHSLFSRKILAGAAEIGLTPGQPKILDFLLSCGEADQKTIASYCEIEPATAGSILLRMEQAGLILRRQKNGNRRSLFVSLTDAGKQAAQKMDAVFRKAETSLEETLSREEILALKNSLDKLCTALSRKQQK